MSKKKKPLTEESVQVARREDRIDTTASNDRCPICLVTPVNNPSLVSPCLHTFCFECIKTWAEITARFPTCPLCKCAFDRVIHNIVSERTYDTFFIPFDRISPGIARVRRGWGHSSFLSNNVSEDNDRGRTRSRESSRSLGYERTGESGERGAQQRQRARAHLLQYSQLARARGMSRDEVMAFRRALYVKGRRALPEWEPRLAARTTRSERVIHKMFCKNDDKDKAHAAMSHLSPFLQRELQVAVGDQHAAFVYKYLTGLLQTGALVLTNNNTAGTTGMAAASEVFSVAATNPENNNTVSAAYESALSYVKPFLFDRASHFLHELHYFAVWPLGMHAYDAHVRYPGDSEEEVVSDVAATVAAAAAGPTVNNESGDVVGGDKCRSKTTFTATGSDGKYQKILPVAYTSTTTATTKAPTASSIMSQNYPATATATATVTATGAVATISPMESPPMRPTDSTPVSPKTELHLLHEARAAHSDHRRYRRQQGNTFSSSHRLGSGIEIGAAPNQYGNNSNCSSSRDCVAQTNLRTYRIRTSHHCRGMAGAKPGAVAGSKRAHSDATSLVSEMSARQLQAELMDLSAEIAEDKRALLRLRLAAERRRR